MNTGEFAFIRWLRERTPGGPQVIVGPGWNVTSAPLLHQCAPRNPAAAAIAIATAPSVIVSTVESV